MEGDAKEAAAVVNKLSVDELSTQRTYTSPMKVATRSDPMVLSIDGSFIAEASGLACAASVCMRGTSMASRGK